MFEKINGGENDNDNLTLLRCIVVNQKVIFTTIYTKYESNNKPKYSHRKRLFCNWGSKPI